MTQNEMIEKLSEKCSVTRDEARTVLENADWNMLTATHTLEKEQFSRMQEVEEVASAGEAAAVQFAPAEGADEAADEATADEATASNAAADAQAEIREKAEAVRRAWAKKNHHGQGARKVGEYLRHLVAVGNRNRFEVRKGDEMVIDLPVTALVLALVCAFWVCLPLMVIGLFAGCRYSFGGKELGREEINSALAKAADAADHVKQSAAKA